MKNSVGSFFIFHFHFAFRILVPQFYFFHIYGDVAQKGAGGRTYPAPLTKNAAYLF
jgi:hypothetical protein